MDLCRLLPCCPVSSALVIDLFVEIIKFPRLICSIVVSQQSPLMDDKQRKMRKRRIENIKELVTTEQRLQEQLQWGIGI